ncbi:DUF748 domain-containing protein [Ramlibacter sp. AW1]|uniref:DUF748 domain-containing protein n=1 Tax=Ramlibacter aurantiacus TaxID=2801330 RepID=A0A936ZFU8_9BURK|nr:DUF748 domain-containing protein [Ramlibacter aurantiacus]MBL0419117.1 DUF748 domain-containing protein [Ramlibacter aurantiacus]
MPESPAGTPTPRDRYTTVARILRWTLAVVAVLLAVHALLGFLFVPWLAQRYVPPAIEQKLGRDVRVGEFTANPFLFTVEANQVVVEGDAAEPLLAMERLFVDVSPWSLVRGIWTLDEVRAEGLRLHAVLQADGTFNLAELARNWQQDDSSGEPPRVVIDRLELSQARLTLTDRRGGQAAEWVVSPIDASVEQVATFQQDTPGSYQVSAALAEGGSLGLRGTIALAPAVAVSGSFELQDLQAQTVWPLVSSMLRMSPLRAMVDLSGRYSYGPGQSLQLEGLRLAATDVLVGPPGAGEPLLVSRRITAQGVSVDTAGRRARLEQLVLADGRVRFEVAADGILNWARIVPADGAEPSPQPSPGAAWQIDVAEVGWRAMDVSYLDRNQARPLSVQTAGLSAELRLSLTAGGGPIRLVASGVRARWKGGTLHMAQLELPTVELGAAVLEQGRFDLLEREISAGSLRLESGRVAVVAQETAREQAAGEAEGEGGAPWRIRLDRLEFAQLGGSYAAGPRAHERLEIGAIQGHLGLVLELGGEQAQVVASGVEAQVSQVAIGQADRGSALRVSSGAVSGGSFDLAQRRVAAKTVEVNGSVTVVRGESGELVLPALLEPGGEPKAEADAPWRYSFDRVQLPSLAVQGIDRTLQPALAVSGQLQGHLTGLSSDSPATFELALKLASGGRLSAKGSMAPDAARASARLEASGVALPPLQPLLERFAALDLRSGTASADGSVLYDREGGDLRVEGRVGLSDVRLDERVSGDRFLSWKQLDVRGAVFDLAGRELMVEEIDVLQPGAKIVVSEDRDLNLVQVLKRDDDPATPGGSGESSSQGPTRFGFVLKRIRLQQGEVDFADLSLVLPFSTTIQGLDGTILDVSSDPSRRAVVKAAGSVQPYGSARVEGTVVPVAPSRSTDLRVEFDNILVPPLSPYTATFAGRKVQSGRLWLDLRYRVQDGELLGSNEIRLQDFRLGERVEAPNAWDIPLDTVIALLADADGDIRLSVPVTGEMGSAKFSVASAVRQAVGNVLRRIVSAPFRALAGLLGTDNKDTLGSVAFSAGSSALRPQEIEKLDALARAMRERPRVRLVVEGAYDPQQDARMLQREQARRELAQALGEPVDARQDPGPIAFDDPTTRRALRRMLRSVAGDEAVQELEQRFPDEAQGLYEAMFDRIAASQPLPQASVQVLGTERSREIAGYLRKSGIAADRITTGQLSSVNAGKDGEVSTQLGIAAAPEGGG